MDEHQGFGISTHELIATYFMLINIIQILKWHILCMLYFAKKFN